MTNYNLVNLGNKIRKARLDCRLTQSELADQTGVCLKSIQNIERGQMNPSYKILYLLINRLGIPANSLFDQEPSAHDKLLQEIIITYERCDPQFRKAILVFLKTLENLDRITS